MIVSSLYVHVPFCARKCEYCAFYSEALDGEIINRYVAALVRELELVAPALKPRTVFFGGGTPSLLNLRQWEEILRAMDRLGLLGAAEWTVECNPATVSADKARLLRDFGVNRISMGVQSLDASLLERLGRIHSREQVFKSFDVLRQAGFDNLNVDLMFAIPGQTLDHWRATLDEALALGSEHLSCYEVIYEEDTSLFEQLRASRFDVNEDLACAMYDEFLDRAGAAGFRQYEIANLARDRRGEISPKGISRFEPSNPVVGRARSPLRAAARRAEDSPPYLEVRGESFKFEVSSLKSLPPAPLETENLKLETHSEIPALACQHNVNYWRGGAFYGLGPSATSYVGGVRTKNWSNTRLYCEQLEQGRRALESSEQLGPLARAGETAAFGLRMPAGWPFAEFQRVTGMDLRVGWQDDMAKLVAQGWGRLTPERFQLTREGLRFADAAAELFLRPEA